MAILPHKSCDGPGESVIFCPQLDFMFIIPSASVCRKLAVLCKGTMTDPRQPSDTPSSRHGDQTPLTQQERVYFEMFRAIELLGRKLERSETVREDLSRRLSDIESGAVRDEATGKLYLPARIEPQAAAASAGTLSRRLTLGAAFGGLALGVIALGMVLSQQMPQQPLSPRQMAALNALTDVPSYKFKADQHTGWQPVAAVAQAADAAALGADKSVLAQATQTPPVAAQLNMKSPHPEIPDDAQDDDNAFQLAEALDDLQPEEGTMPNLPAFVEDETVFETALASAQVSVPVMLAEVPSVPLPPEDIQAPLVVGPPTAALATVVAPIDIKPQVVAVEQTQTEQKPAAQVAVETAPAAPLQKQPARDAHLPPLFAAMEQRAYDGVPEAQHDLATLYAGGQRVARDYPRAAYWFQQAASQGIANAWYNLGVMSQQGLGLPKSDTKAFGYYKSAAHLGHPEAMYNLGLAYIEARGTQRDNLRGVSYFKRAANAGLTQAAYNLGVLYEGGSVIPEPDMVAALDWYRVAAAEGHLASEKAVARLERLQQQKSALSRADEVEPAGASRLH